MERQCLLKEQEPKLREGFPDGKFIPERVFLIECDDLMIEREHRHVRSCVCGKAAGSDGSISKDRQQIVLFDLAVVHSGQEGGMEQMSVETAGSCTGSRAESMEHTGVDEADIALMQRERLLGSREQQRTLGHIIDLDRSVPVPGDDIAESVIHGAIITCIGKSHVVHLQHFFLVLAVIESGCIDHGCVPFSVFFKFYHEIRIF